MSSPFLNRLRQCGLTPHLSPYLAHRCSTLTIGTETGMIEMLKLNVPGKTFFAAPPGGTCVNMKKNNLNLVFEALENEAPVITVPEEIRWEAKKALDRMVEVG